MKNLGIFKAFVDEIIADNSRTEKMRVLKKYSDDDNVKFFLDFVYNPYIVTGISDKKISKTVTPIYFEDDIYDYLKQHNTGRDEDIARVQFVMNELSEELRPLFKAVVTKNLNLGVDSKTINKVIPSLLPEFNIMLANKYFDNPSVVEDMEFAITTKIDGGRIVALKENGIVSFYTRAGQKYEGLVDLENELSGITEDNFMLDGELTLLDKGTLVSKEQYKETMKISRKDGIKHGLKMLVFDWLPISDFKAQKSTIHYNMRRVSLNTLFYNNPSLVYFELLPVLYFGDDTSKITEFLNRAVANGEEGIMINDVDAPYAFKRSNSLLKVKLMNDLDLKVIGFEEGTNRHAGRLGALIVDYKGNAVKVGSGFSDELRDEIWQNKNTYLGRLVAVQYFEITTATTGSNKGKESLRFPVFIDFRDPWDKATPDF